jgi:MFS family permease
VSFGVVLTYLIGLSAALDPRGRWAVIAGSASSLGLACGPPAGTLLSAHAGYAGMGVALGCLLLVVAVPLTAVALRVRPRGALVVTPIDLEVAVTVPADAKPVTAA